ncbi:antibiotic biosynthesis monooxygenase family protein [Pedococcus sp. 5OH_020]|uniref:antibiotic biosynthesis monooxygenase family protein n=1 Tax=Pedococcus sp. 5OH_020 TaxID=2989814 RepID=UPI0022E9C24F|nr:antibiotic biosynthesis monooxygenase family protein [Pedococcus sp. 5OH_020]
MTNRVSADARVAEARNDLVPGPVTLMNSFTVPHGRDEEFHAMWDRTSRYFIAQPGFVSLRLHRALSPRATHRWVNVASWDSEADYRAAHSTEEFRRIVTQPGWEEFPSSPVLYEVVTSVG